MAHDNCRASCLQGCTRVLGMGGGGSLWQVPQPPSTKNNKTFFFLEGTYLINYIVIVNLVTWRCRTSSCHSRIGFTSHFHKCRMSLNRRCFKIIMMQKGYYCIIIILKTNFSTKWPVRQNGNFIVKRPINKYYLIRTLDNAWAPSPCSWVRSPTGPHASSTIWAH